MSEEEDAAIAEMRESYELKTLNKKELNANPFAQFQDWFDAACESEIREPNAMTLATVGIDKIPTCRTVLLKGFDDRGFSFFTNYQSRKGKEIEAHPAASLLFLWKELERQVMIRGRVELVSISESDEYFQSRPYESRIGAWASEQSSDIPSRKLLEQRNKEMRNRYPDNEEPDCVPLPDFWGGYRVVPLTIEFWQGGPGRLHDRFEYRRGGKEGWEIQRLSP